MAKRRVAWVLLVPAGVTFGCGVWQLNRMQWKNDLIDLRVRTLNKPVISATSQDMLRGGDGADSNLEYRRLNVTGVFDHTNEMCVGPRSRPGKCESQAPGGTAPSGYTLVTPLNLKDGGTILINRGWVPTKLKDKSLRPETLPLGTVTVDAVVRPVDQPGLFVPKNSPPTTWFSIIPSEMATAAHIPNPSSIICADIVADSNEFDVNHLPVPKPISEYSQFRTMPSMHITYAGTWFALSACSVIISVLAARR